MSGEASFERFTIDGTPVLRIQGDLDFTTAPLLRVAAARHVTPADGGLVIDMGDVAYLDSAGIHLLVQLAEVLGAHRQQLRVVLPADSLVRRVVLLAGLESLLSLDDDLDRAVSCLRPA